MGKGGQALTTTLAELQAELDVEVDLTGAELQQLGCCCASPDWTDVTKGCTAAWLKENGY